MQKRLRRIPWLVPLTALAAGLALGCHGELVLLEPPQESQAPSSGDVPVRFALGAPLETGQRLELLLELGLSTPESAPGRSVDLTPRVAFDSPVSGGVALSAADLEAGLHRVRLRVYDADGRRRQRTSLFSWEPGIDLSRAAECELFDPRHCLLPYPSNRFTRADPGTDTGLRLDFPLGAMPSSSFGTPANPAQFNQADGFSIGTPLLLHVPGLDLDRSGAPPLTDMPRSLLPDSPLVLVDAETLRRIPAWMELDDDIHAPDPADKTLYVRPGVNFFDGRRYVVGLRRLVDVNGAPLAPERAFQVYRDAIPTFLPEIEARREAMEEIFGILAEAGVARDELYLAWDFTVQSTRSISERLLHMRDEALGGLGGGPPDFQVEEVIDDASSTIRRQVGGTFEVPSYLTGDGSAGSQLQLGPDGLPERNGTFTARFLCRIPYWVEAPDGSIRQARPSLYGHGLFGTEREVRAGNVGDMANEHGFVFCATRWTGMEEEDVLPALAILQDFGTFQRLPERLHQGQLNQLFLARLLKHPDGFWSHPDFRLPDANGVMQPTFDNAHVFYDGNSQGGIQSGALAAISQDITRFVMGVPGMNYSTLLKRSVDFDPFFDFLRVFYTDPTERNLLIAMAEILWERAEANGHVHHIVSDPYPDTPPKTILLHPAFADHQVSTWTAEIWARTIEASGALPPVNHPDREPLWGIPQIQEYPFHGSAIVYWDSGNPPPPVSNVPPREGPPVPGLATCAARRRQDPHECPRRQPEARLQKSLFLMPDGAVFDTCGGAPCVADNAD